MRLPYLTGYCDRLGVKNGERLSFMVSGHGADTAEVQIVRLIHGDENPAGPGFIEREIDASCNGTIAVAEQTTQVGSFMVIDGSEHFDPAAGFTVHAFIWPTTPAQGPQGIVTRWDGSKGAALMINENGCLAVSLGDGAGTSTVAADVPLASHTWYFVSAAYDPASGELTLSQEAVINAYNSRVSSIVPRDDTWSGIGSVALTPVAPDVSLLLAGFHGAAGVEGLYNGKIDRAGIHARTLSGAELAAIRDGAAGRRPVELLGPDGRIHGSGDRRHAARQRAACDARPWLQPSRARDDRLQLERAR